MSTDNNMCTVKKRWVDVENPDLVKEYKIRAEDPDEVPWMAEYAKSKLDSYVYEDPNCHIRASPLFELSSIKLIIDFSETKDIGYNNEVEVYGHIRLIDDKGNMFTLFKLDYENAKHVILEESSPIILEKPQLGTPRFLPKNLELHIFLKDRIRNIVLFDDCKFLSFSREVQYDDVMYRTLNYNVDHFPPKSPRLESLLELGYTIFHCAVLASVSVTVLSVGNDHHQGMNLKLRAPIELRNSQVCHELFDDEPAKLEIGVPKELCVLAVPVYSPLKIIASFNTDGVEDIVRELEFYPRDTHYESGEKVEGQNYQMLVSVTWASALKTLPEKYLREWDDAPSSSDSDTDSEIKKGDIIKNPPRKKPFKVHHTDDMMGETCDRNGYFIQPQLEALDKRRWVVTSRPHEYVELFSVSIHSFDGAVSSSITGRINVYGLVNKQWDYFSGSEKKTGTLYPSVTCKSLKGPNFGMEFDLEDAKGHQISRGYLDYDDRNVEAWYNRRVCSVVVGKCGYAAAYYTIFECGKQARLKIRLMMPENNNGVVVCVSGTIHARYSNYSYSTKYDKDYFQSTLFEEGKSESVRDGGELPLTKSVVAVPYNGSLIVKPNLRVSIDGEHVETLKGKATFKPRNENEEDAEELKKISSSTSSSMYHLSVNVVWGFPEFVRRCSTSS